MIIDCVQQAGIDVSAWSFRGDGQPVALPQSNGGYCYEWSFRSSNGIILLLCVWFEELQVDNQGRIFFSRNFKMYAENLIQQLEKVPKNRNRTIKDARVSRAGHFHSTIQLAHLNAIPVRVVIVSGPVRESDEIGPATDRAIGRYLDDEFWHVENFNGDTGVFILVRGDNSLQTLASVIDPIDGMPHIPEKYEFVDARKIVDQFHSETRPSTYTYQGVQRYRDPDVRAIVLARSKGICELTMTPGFRMANGGTYLETHHIIPLCEGGSDTVENVIALSADAHRQAHYALNGDELRQRCLEIVRSYESAVNV
ncbi:5-methylcytosine-specific restriction enzyme A [Pseudomonas mediterranea]